MRTLDNMTEPEITEYTTNCGIAIEYVAEKMDIEQPLFIVVLFNDPRVAAYVSNCDPLTTIEAMREVANRLEKREDIRSGECDD